MLLFIDFCELWWLAWLLPFILGLGLGWLLWSRFKSLWSDSEANVNSLSSANSKLNADLTSTRNMKADLEGDVALMKGRVREVEGELESVRAQLKACQDKGGVAKAAVSSLSAVSAAVSSGSGASGSSGARSSSGAKLNPYAKLKNDNLQIVEGIGPKMESVLHENGVMTWSDLAGKSEDDLRNILSKYGDKYRIIDPSSWSAQASKAGAGDWPGLISLQKSLDGGRGDTGNNSTDSKLEKLMMKMGLLKRYKQDDLKAVEGIGPKIAELLKKGGINTWRELANTEVAKIQGILDDAGSRYQLADPGTWPKQAELAADGKWDELQEYQDFLDGGK